MVVVNTQELVNEVSDEKRFLKNMTPGLAQVRNVAGDGLFTVCCSTILAKKRLLTTDLAGTSPRRSSVVYCS